MSTPWIKAFLAYPLEAFAVAFCHYGLKIPSLDTASDLGGAVLRRLGPLCPPLERRALLNLEKAFPEKNQKELREITEGMWDNFGRVVAEYSHLRKLAVSWDPSRITVSGREYLREGSQPSLFFTAHYANWEVAALAIMHEGLPLMQVYRSAENPLVNHMIRRAQRQIGDTLIPSGRAGAKQLLEALRQKTAVLMLLDQRKKNGLPVPFFGYPALTAPAIGRLALRHKCPLIPVQVLRLGRTSRFEVRFFPPLPLPQQGSSQERLLVLMTAVNQHIEAWVRERSDLWFWVHNRWKLS